MLEFNNKCSNEEKKKRTEQLDKIAYERFLNGESITKIAKSYNMNRCRLSKRLQEKYNISPCLDGGKISIDSNYFNALNNENCYWLGLILADGSISKDMKTFELTLKDKEHIQKFMECIKSKHKLSIKHLNGQEYYRVSFNDNNIINRLLSLGILPNKSNIDFDMPNIPDIFFSDFLRGLIDGDGGYYVYNYNNIEKLFIVINIGLHSHKFANQILNKINNFYNVNGKLYQGKTCYSIRFAKRDSIKLINILFECSSLYLQRKYSKIEKYIIKGGDAK